MIAGGEGGMYDSIRTLQEVWNSQIDSAVDASAVLKRILIILYNKTWRISDYL